MADVRLTATNPEDSSVVPVACDASGRLLLQDPEVVEGPQGPQGPPGQDGDPFSGNFAGDVTFEGATFAGDISVDGGTTNENSTYGPGYSVQNRSQSTLNLWSGQLNGSNTSTILANGSCKFAGDHFELEN